MNKLIQQYLAYKSNVWSKTTLRSETYRLASVSSILNLAPMEVYTALSKDLGRYSVLTTWIRIVSFLEWCSNQVEGQPGKTQEITQSAKAFRAFRTENPRLFSGCYTRKAPKISYSEAKNRILKLRTPFKEKALQLLETGMRFGESGTLDNSVVIGKGNKRRQIFLGEIKDIVEVDYNLFYRELRKIGLKPHDLRKLFASQLVDNGANEFQLTQIMGWENINTAQAYIRTDHKKLESLVNKIRN